MTILTPRGDNMIHPSVSLSSLGLEGYDPNLLKDTWNAYDDGVVALTKTPDTHPEVWDASCSEHGPEYMERFLQRCEKYIEHRKTIWMNQPSLSHVVSAQVFVSCIQLTQIRNNNYRFIFPDRDANRAYQNLVGAATFDATTTMSSGWDYEETHRNCLIYGIEFIDQLVTAGLSKNFRSEYLLKRLSVLRELGADIFSVPDLMKSHARQMEQQWTYLLEMIQSGIPLEYALSALDEVKAS